MITFTLIFFALLAASLDYLIFRRYVTAVKWLKYPYLAQIGVFDVGVFGYLVYSLLQKETDPEQASMSLILMWVMFLFLMSFGVKVIIVVSTGLQWMLRKIFKRRFRWVIYSGLGAAVVLVAVMIYGSSYGRLSVRVEHVVIESVMLPEEFDGFKIAQFSDTHLGNLGAENPVIERMVELINAQQPDIVVQTGDLIDKHSGELTERFMAQFAKIEAPVYSVMGNHDLSYYIHGTKISARGSYEDLVRKQKQMGWRLLRNEHLWLHRGGDSIALVGSMYPRDGRFGVNKGGFGGSDLIRTFEQVPDSLFSILLSHTPALFDSIPEFVKPNLTISGHVHSMQTKVTIGSWSWSPAKWLYPMWSGLWIDRGRYLYINDGIGCVLYPMRLGARPEITLFELRQKK